MVNFDSKVVGYKLKSSKPVIDVDEVIIPTDVKLPADAPARMKTLRAEGKKWYLTIVYHEDTEQPFAMFCKTNHKEQGAQTSDAIDRLTSLALRKGILPEHVEKVIEKSAHENNVAKLTRNISLLLRHGVRIRNIVSELDGMEDIYAGSFLYQIKKFLSQYIKDGESVDNDACGSCGGVLVFSEVCMTCRDCGSSKCG